MNITELFNKKNYQTIVDLANKNPTIANSDPHAGRLIAVSYYMLGLYSDSLKHCSNLYSFFNGDPDFLAFYGSCLRKEGLLDDANRIYKDSLDLHPESLTLLNNYANLLLDIGSLDRAEVLLKKALGIDPNYNDAISNLSRLNFLRNDNLPVSENLSRTSNASLGYDPLSSSFSPEEVKRTFQDKFLNSSASPLLDNTLAESLPPRDLTAEQQERIALIRKSIDVDPKLALTDAKSLLTEIGINHKIYNLVGDIYVRLKLFGDAESCYYSALILGSDDPSNLLNLANIVHMRGDQMLSFKFLEILSLKSPDFPQLKKAHEILFPSGKPSASTTPFQYNPEQASQGSFQK